VFYTYLDELQAWAGKTLRRRAATGELAPVGAD
jgi:hypothetical protein